ncbi:MAG: type I restriction-modification system subunit M [Chitinispirillales bacterium]|jgi:type I restriction enzyme M protein|nr:type I restriction-modification system subunit M [Chitinispirillales bacterium]
MDNQTYNSIVSFIWGIADDCLRDVYVRGKYRDVILPMTVIRRLDAVLEDTKDDVLKKKKWLDDKGILNQNEALCKAAKQSFCNSSPFLLKNLTGRASQQKLKADFAAYLDGFSPNVQEILKKFKFHVQIDTMVDADILGAVIEKFVSPTINLSPYPILDDLGGIKFPALDNHTMGTVFEELIRRFNEENNEEAGEHFTPRDVVELMADLIFLPVADKITDSTYSCYDGASGTGGMLTLSQERLQKLAESKNKDVSIHLFGQEINPETFAIARADMLLKGEGAENIAYGSTLSDDHFPTRQFDFMLSNPPYGKSWKNDADKLGGKKGITDSRFVTPFAGDAEFSMLPRVSDGQLLFLLNNVSKMKESTPLGSRIAEVHNGSSLFTGDAGQGESNARRYLIERDLVEAIIALPNNMFYNTGIGTYIWVLSNRKEKKRKGKIQLIDATALKQPLRKNLGNKNCEFTTEIRKQIIKMYMKSEENEYSKIFPNSAFGYYKVTVLRPQYGEDGKPLRDKKKNLIPDKQLTDTEQIPLDYEGGISAFIKKEVLPYSPDAWVDESNTQTGYEISFTKHFYKPVRLRELSEIVADIKALERETEGLLEEALKI